jgi:hypothetical protein
MTLNGLACRAEHRASSPIVVVRPGGRTAVTNLTSRNPTHPRRTDRFWVRQDQPGVPESNPGCTAPVHCPPWRGRTHAHVVGTTFVENRSYTPPPTSGGQYLGMLDATRDDLPYQDHRHGTDNDVMLMVVNEKSDRLRAELSRLAANNVVGLRPTRSPRAVSASTNLRATTAYAAI